MSKTFFKIHMIGYSIGLFLSGSVIYTGIAGLTIELFPIIMGVFMATACLSGIIYLIVNLFKED